MTARSLPMSGNTGRRFAYKVAPANSLQRVAPGSLAVRPVVTFFVLPGLEHTQVRRRNTETYRNNLT